MGALQYKINESINYEGPKGDDAESKANAIFEACEKQGCDKILRCNRYLSIAKEGV